MREEKMATEVLLVALPERTPGVLLRQSIRVQKILQRLPRHFEGEDKRLYQSRSLQIRMGLEDTRLTEPLQGLSKVALA